MSSAVLMERGSVGSAPNLPGFSPAQATVGTPATPNYCVVPRCELKFEKCAGGYKIHCKCPDEISCATLQNLCKMLADCMCSCCCTWNGITICQCNLCCGTCKCEYTKDGVCITCTSGDKACCEMIQKCCECCEACCKSGSCCYICLGNTPICCGTCC